MPYCVNPACPNPENLVNTESCQACGSKLTLHDRYEICRALGQGGFGATFLAKNLALPGSPQCVIKQLRPNTSAANVMQMARDLFHREAKTLGKIGSHPQIPTLLDFFEERTEFYLVQEFISGLNLQQEIKENGPMSEAGVKQFLSELLPMLQYLHSQQVIHRDIKPANIIRRNHDRKLVLIDFGAVKDQVNPAAASLSEQTALTSYAIGTPGYAPPEQMAMRPVYSSDIYAVGVTCIYLLTAKSPKDLNYNPATGEMMWRQSVDVSDHFADVLSKMLESSVKHRYQMANEVLKELDMEPYLESLASSLIKPAGVAEKTVEKTNPRWRSPVRDPIASSSEDIGSSTRSPSASKMAEAIRARKNRRAVGRDGNVRPDTTQIHAAVPKTRSKSTIPRNNTQGPTTGIVSAKQLKGDRPPQPLRLNAVQVQESYSKGKLDFASHDLSNLNLQRSNLSNSNFYESRLFKTNFQGCDLSNADFSKSTLKQANLRDTKLVRAYMNYANLQEADLRGADLSYAYLSNANLRGANLSGANLTGAKVTEEQLAQAKMNWNTVMPSGKRKW